MPPHVEKHRQHRDDEPLALHHHPCLTRQPIPTSHASTTKRRSGRICVIPPIQHRQHSHAQLRHEPHLRVEPIVHELLGELQHLRTKLILRAAALCPAHLGRQK
eukprot:24296-Eustigmatos_ZCMA.PRE.1